jgi:putative DNA primase/helicase
MDDTTEKSTLDWHSRLGRGSTPDDLTQLIYKLVEYEFPDKVSLRLLNGWADKTIADEVERTKLKKRIPVLLAERHAQVLDRDQRWTTPDPLPDTLLPVKPFDADALLPEVFAAVVADAADRMQCPPDFVAVPMLVAWSSVIGRQCGIRPKRKDNWLVVPNLWGAVVGMPGEMKSPGMMEGLAPLNRLIAETRAQWDRDAAIREAQDIELAGRRKKLTGDLEKVGAGATVPKSATKGDNYTPEEIREAWAAFKEREKAMPTERLFLTNDPTIEKIAVMLETNPIGMMVHRDELSGWLNQMNRDGHENDRAFYNESWDGRNDYRVDRMGRPSVTLRGMCLSILGGIQPGPLVSHLGEVFGRGASNDGMVQRLQMLTWPDLTADVSTVDREPDEAARAAAVGIFRAAANLSPSDLKAEPGDVPYLRFDDAAQGIFSQWLTWHRKRMRRSKDHDVVKSHLAKYNSLVPSLALLFHLADVLSGATPAGPVTEPALRRAIAWSTYLEKHARRVYQSVTDTGTTATRALAERIMAGDLGSIADVNTKPFTVYKVRAKHWGAPLNTTDAIEGACVRLAELGWLMMREKETGGRPTVEYTLNPGLVKLREKI